jgi:hypothetical protein
MRLDCLFIEKWSSPKKYFARSFVLGTPDVLSDVPDRRVFFGSDGKVLSEK